MRVQKCKSGNYFTSKRVYYSRHYSTHTIYTRWVTILRDASKLNRLSDRSRTFQSASTTQLFKKKKRQMKIFLINETVWFRLGRWEQHHLQHIWFLLWLQKMTFSPKPCIYMVVLIFAPQSREICTRSRSSCAVFMLRSCYDIGVAQYVGHAAIRMEK